MKLPNVLYGLALCLLLSSCGSNLPPADKVKQTISAAVQNGACFDLKDIKLKGTSKDKAIAEIEFTCTFRLKEDIYVDAPLAELFKKCDLNYDDAIKLLNTKLPKSYMEMLKVPDIGFLRKNYVTIKHKAGELNDGAGLLIAEFRNNSWMIAPPVFTKKPTWNGYLKSALRKETIIIDSSEELKTFQKNIAALKDYLAELKAAETRFGTDKKAEDEKKEKERLKAIQFAIDSFAPGSLLLGTWMDNGRDGEIAFVVQSANANANIIKGIVFDPTVPGAAKRPFQVSVNKDYQTNNDYIIDLFMPDIRDTEYAQYSSNTPTILRIWQGNDYSLRCQCKFKDGFFTNPNGIRISIGKADDKIKAAIEKTRQDQAMAIEQYAKSMFDAISPGKAWIGVWSDKQYSGELGIRFISRNQDASIIKGEFFDPAYPRIVIRFDGKLAAKDIQIQADSSVNSPILTLNMQSIYLDKKLTRTHQMFFTHNGDFSLRFSLQNGSLLATNRDLTFKLSAQTEPITIIPSLVPQGITENNTAPAKQNDDIFESVNQTPKQQTPSNRAPDESFRRDKLTALYKLKNELALRKEAGEIGLEKSTIAVNNAIEGLKAGADLPVPELEARPKLYMKPSLPSGGKYITTSDLSSYEGKSNISGIRLKEKIAINSYVKPNILVGRAYRTTSNIPVAGALLSAIVDPTNVDFYIQFPCNLDPFAPTFVASKSFIDGSELGLKLRSVSRKNGRLIVSLDWDSYLRYNSNLMPDPRLWPPEDAP